MNKKTKAALNNAGLIAGAVFVGAFSDGTITWVGVVAAASAACGIFFTNMKQFYNNTLNKKAQIQPGIGVFLI